MSSHYSYDIDERNLRTKLKGSETPYAEDIWLKFETYQQTHQKQQSIDDVVKKISFTINRNVILPIVFGSIIIAFSLLLFNFINIKPQSNLKTVIVINDVKAQPKKIEQKILTLKPKIALATTNKIETATSSNTVAVITKSLIATPTLAIVTSTVAKIIVADPIKTNTNLWNVVESGKIYESPNIASTIVGNTSSKESYNALEETVYFIKVAFINNGSQKTGYIRKGTIAKNGQTPSTVFLRHTTDLNNTASAKKKDKKAESLESIKAPSLLGVSSEANEPELK